MSTAHELVAKGKRQTRREQKQKEEGAAQEGGVSRFVMTSGVELVARTVLDKHKCHPRDPFQVLNNPRDLKQARQAYRRLVLSIHPDKCARINNEQLKKLCEEAFKGEMNEYLVFSLLSFVLSFSPGLWCICIVCIVLTRVSFLPSFFFFFFFFFFLSRW